MEGPLTDITLWAMPNRVMIKISFRSIDTLYIEMKEPSGQYIFPKLGKDFNLCDSTPWALSSILSISKKVTCARVDVTIF